MFAYSERIDRNRGLITAEQQEKLKNSCVAIFGMGGIGGIVAEVVARAGVGHIKIIEPDSFEVSNLNRHVFCFESTLGKYKIDVAEDFLKGIFAGITIDKYFSESQENIDEILQGVDVVVLAVDKVRACILISREAKMRGIPLVEGWALPYGNVRVFTNETITLEEAYKLPSIGRELSTISEVEFASMDLAMLETISQFEDIRSFYTEEAEKRIFVERKNPSFAPLVWLTSVLMSLEAIKIVIGAERLSLAPQFSLYDPFLQRVPKQTP